MSLPETQPAPAIPQPRTYGPLGNLPSIDPHAPIQSLVKLADAYGPIFRMELPGRVQTYISSRDLVADACDESRFDKKVWAPLQKVRAFAGDGLFTAWTDEPNWKKAHHILLPSFSQRAMQGYHGMMVDLAVQLVQKWARLNPDESVDVPADMTRLTLDTIGLCGFNYRFNSFYREQPHPFIVSMTRALDESLSQLQRLDLQNKLMVVTKRQYAHDIKAMNALVDSIIAERKAQGDHGEEDLLAHMLHSVDPETGSTLDDANIRYQIITFLIAGHETTSGLLSFALYYLLKNPAVLAKAYEEVDRVLTDAQPTYKQVRELTYLRMILNEALRLWPTAPAFALFAKEDTLLGGTYPMDKGDAVTVLIPKLHRDTAVWGDDVETFRPERFADMGAIPEHAYKPFGNGQRACIGQQFALQEATLVLGMLLKQFEIIDHTNYQLKIKETLTLKPEGFTMRVRARKQGEGRTQDEGRRTKDESVLREMVTTAVKPSAAADLRPSSSVVRPSATHNTPLLVLYGSNLGTAEGIARELADAAQYQGFRSEVAALDTRIGKLSTAGAVIIVTASYNGQPPDNAREFVAWLGQLGPQDLAGVRYTVFGCGDHNWASTYQRIPRLIDEQLAAKGATRLVAHGEGDASDDFEAQLDSWRDALWPEVTQAFDLALNANADQEVSSLSVRFVSSALGTPLAATYEAQLATVVANRELQGATSERSTRHIEIALPEGVTYQAGDHLGVLPRNPQSQIDRVLRRYHLNGNDHLILSGSGRSVAHLPLDRSVSVEELVGQSVELQEAATRAQLRELAAFTVCPPHKRALEALSQEDVYKAQVLTPRLTMLDLLERYPACELPFERFLELLPALKPRYYSISSSPRVAPQQASITVGVVRGPARSGNGAYRGVASNYLAERAAGDEIVMFVRSPQHGFHPPVDAATPMIMVGPGTGLAPFRGFVQERLARKQAGEQVGPALLFFGCRTPEHDFIYRDELAQFEAEGVLTLITAFSRVAGQPTCYVQQNIAVHADEVWSLLEAGATIYVCGDGSRMAPDVRAAFGAIYRAKTGADGAAAEQWLKELESAGRYVVDVWASS